MSSLKDFKAITDLDGFAHLLGYRPKALAYLLYKLPAAAKYRKFHIPKKDGGTRTISAPLPRIKLLQRRFADLLYGCQSEIQEIHQRNSLSHGFRRSHSIFTNASCHKGRRYVLNLDLQDFFPSINFGRVRGFFIKDWDFALHEKAATIAAQIACYENSLPQGSPCSPIISDLVAHLLDRRLARLAAQNKCTYSRYADDLTFSTSLREFPAQLAIQLNDSEWTVGEELAQQIDRCGFAINESKTRMQCRGSRQMVTGLTVNKKVNITAAYYRRARALCNQLFKTGSYYRGGKHNDENEIFTTTEVIEGILSHISFIKEQSDLRPEEEKRDEVSGARRLYKRFLFYKHCLDLDLPMIICEGKTDSVYLRFAMRALEEFQPTLGAFENGVFRPAVRFFNYGGMAARTLRLEGGTGDLAHLMLRYKHRVSSYAHAPMRHPVIVLSDNDDGARRIFSVLREMGISVTGESTSSFYRVSHNLYFIKTPENGRHETRIEDMFHKNVLETKLEGKTFNPKKEHDADGQYGKHVFAERVIRPHASQIDFTNFSALLARIEAAIDHYRTASDQVSA